MEQTLSEWLYYGARAAHSAGVEGEKFPWFSPCSVMLVQYILWPCVCPSVTSWSSNNITEYLLTIKVLKI